jgi:hypothetical protein
MGLFERIAEERIQRAAEQGVFDNLPGKGKPFAFDDDSMIPEDLRLAWKILKNSGCVPPEVETRKQIFSLRQLFDAAIDPEDRRRLRRELNHALLRLHLESSR